MKAIRAVLFDLDGTLLDSAPDLVGALNWVRQGEGLEPLDVKLVSRFVTRGAAGLLKGGMPETDETQFESWKARLLERYASHSFEHSVLFPGVSALLDYLDETGIPWGIVTNKSEALTFPIVKAAGWSERTNCVVCGDTLEQSKPDPAPVILACDLLKTSSEQTLFAGDDVRDLQAGRAARTMTAAIHYGYGSYELNDELLSGSAQIHHASEIIELVKNSKN